MEVKALVRRELLVGAASLCLLVLCLPGCAELEVSHDAIIDFEEYPSTRVQVRGSRFAPADARHLRDELRRHSGFRDVVLAPEPAATLLHVQVTSLVSTRSVRRDEIWVLEREWEVIAAYELMTNEGVLIVSDRVVRRGDTEGAVRRRALDRVVVDFLPSYYY